MSVLVRPARARDDYDACVRLQREVWGLSDLEITSAIQLVATVHAGGLLLVAESPGEGARPRRPVGPSEGARPREPVGSSQGVVGFCYAFAALREGETHLHSDMLAVRPAARGRGIGLLLKWAQREEALRRGVRLVTWTFDPLRAPNARLNLRRLGAVAREVLPDLYGETTSALHHGLPTDRLLARWELDSPRVARRAAGETAAPPALAVVPALNDLAWRGGLPVSSPPRLDLDAPELLLEIPDDWDAVCRTDAALARKWQEVVRRALGSLFARGYAAVDFASTGGARPRAGYVLRKDGLGT